MTPTPKSRQPETAIYVWAVVILVLIGASLVMGILLARPQSDWIDVVGNVAKGLAPTIAAVLAFLKSQETHLSVNSRLDAFMAEHAKNAHAEGVIQGLAEGKAAAPADSQNGMPVVTAPVAVGPPVPPRPVE